MVDSGGARVGVGLSHDHRARTQFGEAAGGLVQHLIDREDVGGIVDVHALAYYKSLNANLSVYFELETEYDPEKIEDLLACDAIHLSGGSTYNFLYWLRARRFIPLLRDYVANGGVLIGVSAGAILMTPEISTTCLCGEQPSHNLNDLSALNFVDFAFLPHINQIESPEAKLIEYSVTQKRKIFGCNDGDGIIVDGDNIQCIGNLICAENGNLQTAASPL